ncbi:MAG: NAD(P)H-hydrate dehydratase, partial [Clostridiales Family XIII bacterium]|nr:NAD(P)H-hydrate dehydratase [Clostridiales Family XIII bacterium]
TCVDRSPSALRDFSEYDAIAMGPGLGTDDETAGVVKNILDSYDGKLVVDADALNIIAARGLATGGKERGARGCGLIITPHPGEAGRLLGVSSADVNADRSAAARSLAERYGAVALLKGRGTVIALPDGYYKVGPYMDGGLYENPTGNPGMATAGSGDVLTGLILALLGQGLDVADAALAGAYLHGLAGDIAAEDKGVHGLIASDIREAIPYAIKFTVSIDTML